MIFSSRTPQYIYIYTCHMSSLRWSVVRRSCLRWSPGSTTHPFTRQNCPDAHGQVRLRCTGSCSPCVMCCLHIRPSFLPNDISSPIVGADFFIIYIYKICGHWSWERKQTKRSQYYPESRQPLKSINTTNHNLYQATVVTAAVSPGRSLHGTQEGQTPSYGYRPSALTIPGECATEELVY